MRIKARLKLESLLVPAVIGVFTIVLGAGMWPRTQAQSSLTPPELRGKEIYVHGLSPSGKEILAYVGESSLEMPGALLACASCHGLDGRGKAEGGIAPSDITAERLTKPYGVQRPDGRKHPPYTDRALELAITRGTDPAGNRLLSVMPRYVMAREDLADLVAYLSRVGKDVDPGISEDKIVIATAIPGKGPLAEMGQAVKAVVSPFFANLNKQGGIYNRQIELKFVETGETPSGSHLNIERLLQEEQVFAMVAGFIAGSENEIVPLMAQRQVPLIGPLTLYPAKGFPLNRHVFYVLSGISEQARTCVDFVAKDAELKKRRLSIVHPDKVVNAQVIEAINTQSQKHGLDKPHAYAYSAGRFDSTQAVKQLKQDGRDVILFLGNGEEALSFLGESDKLSWYPTVFLSSAFAGSELLKAPAGFDGKLFLSFPTSPADQTAEGVKEFLALAERHQLSSKHRAVQLSSYAAALIFVEALKRAGRDLSREKLIDALEGFYEHRTGLTPDITYGPNRRIGALGAYLVRVDLKQQQFVAASGWLSLD